MLIDFSVKNYKCFKDWNTLSMETGERLRKFAASNTLTSRTGKLLKNVILFGPNGSGKTNFMQAIYSLFRLIKSPTSDLSEDLPYVPNALCAGCPEDPTSYRITFEMKGVIYCYELEHDRNQILFEKLTYWKNQTEVVHFERNSDQNQFDVPESLKDMTKRTRANRLFLSVAQDLNDFHSSNVMSWFNDVLLFYNVLPKQQRFGLLSDPMMKEKMLKFLNYCGIDVVDLVVRTREINTDETFRKAMQLLIPNESSLLRESIEMEELFILYNRYHQSGEVAGTAEIPFENESSGTRKLIMIGFMLISQEHPRVMLMDEFDIALHLELSKALVKVINSPENKNQMIMSSHTLELMDCDLRVDQIYLMEKDFKGSSSVYSLFDFEDLPSVARSDIKFAKRYINGQFGAMPTIESDEISKVLFGGVDE